MSAADRKIRVGIVGTGARALAYMPLIRECENATLAALCDIDPARLTAFAAENAVAQDVALTYDHRKLVSMPSLDAVLILTPDTAHRDVFLDTIAAQKHILLEKPIATTVQDAKLMLQTGLGTDKTVALGFVLRHTPFYRRIHELCAGGTLGEVLSISAVEMLNCRHAGSFYRRWHRFSRNNGGLMNAKCSHDMDLLCWMAGSAPSAVAAFGGRRVFVPRTDAAERCGTCPLTDSCRYRFPEEYYREHYGSCHALSDFCVYNSEKDIVDHECILIRFQNGVVAQFELRMTGHEENRRMTVVGTNATLEADFARQSIELHMLDGVTRREELEASGVGHGGGDGGIMRQFFDSIASDTHDNTILDGYWATMLALAGEEAMAHGRMVDLEAFAVS